MLKHLYWQSLEDVSKVIRTGTREEIEAAIIVTKDAAYDAGFDPKTDLLNLLGATYRKQAGADLEALVQIQTELFSAKKIIYDPSILILAGAAASPGGFAIYELVNYLLQSGVGIAAGIAAVAIFAGAVYSISTRQSVNAVRLPMLENKAFNIGADGRVVESESHDPFPDSLDTLLVPEERGVYWSRAEVMVVMFPGEYHKEEIAQKLSAHGICASPEQVEMDKVLQYSTKTEWERYYVAWRRSKIDEELFRFMRCHHDVGSPSGGFY